MGQGWWVKEQGQSTGCAVVAGQGKGSFRSFLMMNAWPFAQWMH